MEEKKKEDLSKEEQRELLKNLRERIKQLRMVEYIDDDEEPDVFIGDGI
jgi:predicted nucleotide-binding protein (sugar kinase/HSP70/actin superfamily)|tara:strand:+ start:324 stop:470 length:147 start_codon:yes stop_codon:yes gene_type:complete